MVRRSESTSGAERRSQTLKSLNVEISAVMLEEVRDVDAVVDPRLDRIVTLDVCHMGVPDAGELTEIPTTERCGVTKPQTPEIGQCRAR